MDKPGAHSGSEMVNTQSSYSDAFCIQRAGFSLHPLGMRTFLRPNWHCLNRSGWRLTQRRAWCCPTRAGWRPRLSSPNHPLTMSGSTRTPSRRTTTARMPAHGGCHHKAVLACACAGLLKQGRRCLADGPGCLLTDMASLGVIRSWQSACHVLRVSVYMD